MSDYIELRIILSKPSFEETGVDAVGVASAVQTMLEAPTSTRRASRCGWLTCRRTRWSPRPSMPSSSGSSASWQRHD